MSSFDASSVLLYRTGRKWIQIQIFENFIIFVSATKICRFLLYASSAYVNVKRW